MVAERADGDEMRPRMPVTAPPPFSSVSGRVAVYRTSAAFRFWSQKPGGTVHLACSVGGRNEEGRSSGWARCRSTALKGTDGSSAIIAEEASF